MMKTFESSRFSGRVIAALAADPEVLVQSGHVVIGAEAAVKYGIQDNNGHQPLSLRERLGSPRPFVTVQH